MRMFVKRRLDIGVSLAGIFFFSIPALFVALAVKLTSRGPVLFAQQRIGKAGRAFTCVKFRTMAIGAEGQGSITAASDSRITPLGSLLRKLKLDEIPQLWNVLIGNMSFVGPRPDVPGYADKLEGDARRILDLRPGITGPASIYLRYEQEILAQVDNPSEFNDTVLWPLKVKMNLEYLDNWSFWRDAGYMLITVFPFLNRWLKLVPPPARRPEEVAAVAK